MEDQIYQADYVLVVATPTYRKRFRGLEEPVRGLGAIWEGAVITQEFYKAQERSTKFIPVIFSGDSVDSIPAPLRTTTYYVVDSSKNYEALYRRLTDQPSVKKPTLGVIQVNDSKSLPQLFDTDSSTFYDTVAWGYGLEDALDRDDAKITNIENVGAGRWLIRIRLPETLHRTYGIAPEILQLAVQGQIQGGDLQKAHDELQKHRFELDQDLLIVTDDRPDLSERVDLMYQIEGQWVPWSPLVDNKHQPVLGEFRFPSLASQLRHFLRLQDIFSWRDPVRGRQTIGRHEVVSELIRSVRRGQPSGIFGLRKIGKTSVARAVTDTLDPIGALASLSRQGRRESDLAAESSVYVIWFDAGRHYRRTIDAVAAQLCKALDERLEAERVDSGHREHLGLEGLDLRLEELLRSPTPLVIVIDEFDLLFESSGGKPPVEGISQLFQMLRAHSQESGRLALMLIGRDPSLLEAPEMEGRTNPMLGWLVPHWLGTMHRQDADLLMVNLGRRVGLEIGEKLLDLAFEWTGGHPRLHREFGSALLAVARASVSASHWISKGHIEVDHLAEQALDQFLERQDVLTICREIFHLLGERYPSSSTLLAELAPLGTEERANLLASRDGWKRPENRILRDFGLVQGSLGAPHIPLFLTWYLQTFEPQLRRHA